MEQFAPYGHALVSMAGVALIGLLMNPISALRKMGQGVAPGGTPEQAYDDGTYRLNRAYLNLTEMMGLFVGCVLAAMLAGVAPFWVNWLASIFFVSRILVAIVHLAGIGPMNFGPRTMIFVVGWACCVALAVMAILAVF